MTSPSISIPALKDSLLNVKKITFSSTAGYVCLHMKVIISYKHNQLQNVNLTLILHYDGILCLISTISMSALACHVVRISNLF